jgi:peptidyl-prolyl cis-trans isomerase B (cyclophilin B)
MKKLLLVSGLASLVGCLALFAQTQKPTAAPAAKAPPAKAEVAKGATETVAILQTNLGKIVIKFYPDKAPNHVKNFQALCKSGFYNGTKFHRVIPGFMIQGGDPNTIKGEPDTWGQGGNVGKDGKEANVKAEFNDIKHTRGIVSMARANDPNSASSQFFICVADAGFLDGKYSVFGEVIEGMDVADKIVNAPRNPSNDRPNSPVAIDKATVEQRPLASAPAAAPGAPATAPAK